MLKTNRPKWADTLDEMKRFYDEEWGFEQHDDQKLFEFLCLETFQIGLGWLAVLKKREGFRHYFNEYQIDKVAAMTDTHIQLMLGSREIVRNELKLKASILNAQAILKLREDGLTFNNYLWSFVDFEPITDPVLPNGKLPNKTDLSTKISRQMKKDGFQFTGPVTVYAFMQSIGMVNARMKNKKETELAS